MNNNEFAKNKRNKIRQNLFILFSLIIINGLSAQDSKFDIIYIGQIATQADLDNEKSIMSIISEYIFGKTEYKLQKPISLFVNNSSDIWVLDQGLNCIMGINKTEKLFYKLYCEKFPLLSLVGVCKINADTILFSDSKLNKLFFFSETSQQIHTFNTSHKLNKPTGIAFNRRTKDIWVVETGNHHISVLTSSGDLKQTISTRGEEQGQFNYPTFIWIDNDGIVYIVDSMNFRVQIFDEHGNYIAMFGEAGDASGFFSRPKGIATDSFGNIYVVDALFNTVQIFNRQGDFLYNFGAKGTGKSEFILPSGIFIDETDKIYVADSYNARIQIFQLDRKIEIEKDNKN